MKIQFAPTLRHYNKKNLPNDIISGIIIALVSIPISMGYAQIAGLPAVYGLYGSVFPILIFSLFSTSPQFIFGVDAAPAALVGSALLSLEIAAGGTLAMEVVPIITFFVALWLLLFCIIKAGKLVTFISEPVMGGFITGICVTIILMQTPKLYGGSSGTGELFELAEHIIDTIGQINTPSLIMGAVSLAILLAMKKLIPKFPAPVVLMISGAICSFIPSFPYWGVNTLSAATPGLPSWSLPSFGSISLTEIITVSLSISVVIMAETLLAENNFARKNGYKIRDNQEIFSFFAGNLVASLIGCCPINGSVSRTTMNEQYHGKTQLTGIIAGLTMILVLLFGTSLIEYLSVPVLTAIVISALMSATEFHLAKKLWKVNKKEFAIFVGAFLGVLILGTINGVLVGIILSFTEMVFRSSKPARYYIGIQPGHKHFRNLKDSSVIFPISGVVIYKFASNLFFANADIFAEDIENGIQDDTIAVIVDASAIGSIDITGANRLESLYKSLKKRNIKFYLTEHISSLNDQLRSLGLGYMIEEGAVRRTIHIALKDLGINRPYPLEGSDNMEELTPSRRRVENRIHEFEWAFGADAEKEIERQIKHQISLLSTESNSDISESYSSWSYLAELDEDEWFEHLEEHLHEISVKTGKDEISLIDIIETRRTEIFRHLSKHHPELVSKFLDQRKDMDKKLKESHPETWAIIEHWRKEHSK